MDYKTKPTSRKDLRRYSKIVRELFHVPPTGAFPVLQVLDKISDVFEGSNYMIVEDSRLSPQTMACCSPNNQGGFTIEIKENVYKGAYEKGVGAFLGFICHLFCFISALRPYLREVLLIRSCLHIAAWNGKQRRSAPRL